MNSRCEWLSVILLSVASALPIRAQMQLEVKRRGELMPIVGCVDQYVVLKDGTHIRDRELDYTIRPGNEFSPGNVDIKDVRTDLHVLRSLPAEEQTNPTAPRFRYHATLVASEFVPDCYAVLTFLSHGSLGTRLIGLGRLGRQAARSVDVELPTQVEAVGSLHVFSGRYEVRTNEHPQAYDVQAYYAALAKSAHGIPAVALVKLEHAYPHVVSHDGQLLASLRERDASLELIVYDLNSMKIRCETRVADLGRYVGDLTWVSDHEVAYVAEDAPRDYPGEVRLHILDANSGKTRMALRNVWSIIESLPGQPNVLVIVQRVHGDSFYKYDVKTGRTYDFEDPESGWYWFDRSGRARVELRYKKDRRLYFVRQTPDGPWRDLDEVAKPSGLRFNLGGADLLDRNADFHSVGPDGDTIYISSRLRSDRFELAAFSLSRGTINQVIARHPNYDLTIEDGGIARLLFAKNSPQLLGIIYSAQKPQVVWLDRGFAAVQKAMDATFPDHVNIPLDWSDDGQTFIYNSFSDEDPGTVYAFRPLKSALIPLLKAGDRLEGRKLARMIPIEFAARDGVKIPAYVVRPVGAKGPVPLLVEVHGGPMARDDWGFDANDQFFASRGFEILRVNYRGSSGYGAAFQAAGLRGRLDQVVIDDIADGVRHLLASGEIDPQRVAIMGASFGGWATYMSLIRYPELYHAGVAIAAVSNWKQALFDSRWTFDNKLGYTFWQSLLARENFEAEDKFIEPALRAGEIHQPVFIIHGELDTVVHATQARAMLEALKKNHVRVQARSFADASHNYWPDNDRIEMLNEVADFLDQNLPAAPSQDKHPLAAR